MSIDSSFASLLRNLNPTGEDPCLTSKTWESIASESGKISSSDGLFTLSSYTPVYDPSTVHESILVRLVINALQGVKSALEDIEVLSEAFFSNPADRTFHRIPGLWNQSLSTNAFGKILKSIGNSGLAFFLLSKFVDYFIEANPSRGRESRDDVKKRCQEMAPNLAENDPEALNGASNGDNIPHRTETRKGHQCSLVNQAFSVAVGKVLGGYLCALNTLISSVQLRRSLKNSSVPLQVSPGVGSLGSVVHSETSVLEVYLHTKEVRTQIEALQNICFFRNANLALLASSREDFIDQMRKFPRGADLLTYLYIQLRDADPVHHALLRFLFVHSCEPYCGFIKSWIYQANICDPYKEFIVENLDESLPSSHGKAGYPSDMLLPSIKERDGVALPCFMKDVRVPLIRAGQQLQVLVKLLDMCNFAPATDDSYGNGAYFSSRLPNLVDILPYWDDSSDPPPCISPLSFSKRNVEAMILKRQTMYKMMREKLESIFPRLSVRCQQITSIGIPYCAVPIFPDSRSGSQNILTAVMSGEGLISCPSAAIKEAATLAAGGEDADASSTSDDFSSETEQSLSFDCSSLNSSEERYDFQESTEIVDIFTSVEPADLSAWGLFSSFVNQSILKRTPGNERPQILQSPSEMNCYSVDPMINLINPQHEEKDLTQCSLVLPSDMAKWHRKSESSDANHPFDTCWSLGGLPKNLFSSDGEYEGEMRLHVTQKVTDENGKISKCEGSDFAKMFVCGDSAMELDMKNMQVKNGKYEDPLTEYWTPKHSCKLLSMNPMLTKNAWFHIPHDSRHAKHMASKKLGLTHFEFSSVEEPYKAYGERLDSSFNPVFQFEPRVCTVSGVSVIGGVNECLGEQCPDGDVTPFDKMDQSMLHFSANLSGNSNEILQEKYLSATDSGGAKWENLLSYSIRDVTVGAGGCSHNSVVRFEIPLEVIVDKCLLQEISIQYKYVSDFNIKLLEEGFNLRGHFLALRRYHFMELADWADSFITSLRNHKWHATETSQKVAEVQGFLDLALQRSSCESDQYKERLFISMKGQGMMYPSTSGSGVHAFDFITLGYRVDWPISIVLTPDALKLYSEIFSFLTQVKLAVFSLTDIWHLLKDLKSKASGPDEQEMKNFNMLMKMRQQVNHFVLTLQQYVQSQLSHVSWCRFSYSLKHQVKDMLDLESVHMRYLADSLHICFLSVEAQPVATIIENILQCALDFRSCFAAGGWKVRPGQEDAKELHARINFSQVVSIKSTFEKNLQELYLLYLKSPKHHEFGLCHFWDYLNYNNYFSNVIGKGMGWGPW